MNGFFHAPNELLRSLLPHIFSLSMRIDAEKKMAREAGHLFILRYVKPGT